MNKLLENVKSPRWPVLETSDGALPADELAEEKTAVLNLLKGTDLGSRTVWKIVEIFGGAAAALSADEGTLERVAGLKQETIRDIREAQGADFGAKQIRRVQDLGGRLLLPGEDDYPPLLAMSPSPPVLLYAIGDPLPVGGRAVAVVGSRRGSEAGLELAHQIGAGLARAEVTVVSGLAYGIDAASHRGALQEGGPTVGVLGCGIDLVYPTRHRRLRDEIIRHGTIISELYLGAGPEARNFPMRNRIIAWMTVATVVVEAGARSGSLITANYALQNNREVFAVPGHPLSPGHEGSNHLLKQGAVLARHAGDILEEIGPIIGIGSDRERQVELDLTAVPKGLEPYEARVYEALDPVEKIHADKLLAKLELDTSRLGVILLGLEMKGHIRRLPGDHYIRIVSNR